MRPPFFSAILTIAVLALLTAPAVYAADITVDSESNTIDFEGNQQAADLPGPDGRVSLHEAITAANNTPGPDSITFDLLSSGIDIFDSLPTLDDPTGGTTISGAEIRLLADFPPEAGATTAIQIVSASNVIEGLEIQGFDTGIHLTGPDAVGNAVVGCEISNGFNDPDTSSYGIILDGGASENTIGGFGLNEEGSTVDHRNTIDGMIAVGILIVGEGTSFNHLFGNTVKRNLVAGGLRTDVGIDIYGGASDNLIGGDAGEHNQIHGCDICGIRIFGSDNNEILGNFIGDINQSNAIGICVTASLGRIGSAGFGANTVRGNGIGIQVSSFLGPIEGNLVSDSDGDGIQISNSGGIVVGGTEPGAGNTIENNGGNGVLLDFNSIDVGIIGNVIGGTNEFMDSGRNGRNGIELRGGSNGNSIGGLDTASGNQIRHNGMHGVLVGFDCHQNFISQNVILQNTMKNIMLEEGANQGIQAPVVTQTQPDLRGTAAERSTVEVYRAFQYDLTGSGALLESILVGNSGEFVSAMTAAQLGNALVLAVRDGSGNSSEFTPACLIEDCANPPDPPDPEPPDPVNPLLAVLAFIFCIGDDKGAPQVASADALVLLIGVPALLATWGKRRKGKAPDRRWDDGRGDRAR